jgi:hypothetical protein
MTRRPAWSARRRTGTPGSPWSRSSTTRTGRQAGAATSPTGSACSAPAAPCSRSAPPTATASRPRRSATRTEDPRQATATLVRDTLAAGHATISGGIYVSATVAGVGPGGTASGLPPSAEVDVTVQAAPWVDVAAIELVVDGQTVDTVPIVPADADPANPAVRWRGKLPITVSASGGFVVVAAYGTKPLEPVHPGRIPFGMTNPIFVR